MSERKEAGGKQKCKACGGLSLEMTQRRKKRVINISPIKNKTADKQTVFPPELVMWERNQKREQEERRYFAKHFISMILLHFNKSTQRL